MTELEEQVNANLRQIGFGHWHVVPEAKYLDCKSGNSRDVGVKCDNQICLERDDGQLAKIIQYASDLTLFGTKMWDEMKSPMWIPIHHAKLMPGVETLSPAEMGRIFVTDVLKFLDSHYPLRTRSRFEVLMEE